LRATRFVFPAIASLPLTLSFCLYISRFDVVNSYALIGVATLFTLQYLNKSPKALMMAFYGPVLLAIYTLVFHGNFILILGLGTGYLLVSPILMFLSSLSESPKGMLTSYLFAYLTSLLILEVVMAGATTSQTLFMRLVRLLVAIISERVVPFYPVAGFSSAVELLAIPTALGAFGLVFLVASSYNAFKLGLHDYAGIVKAVLLSIVSTSFIAFLSLESPSTVSLIIATSALALMITVFQVSRRA